MPDTLISGSLPAQDMSTATTVDDVRDWLLCQSLDLPDSEVLVEGFCTRLRGAGVPVTRMHAAFRVLHPHLTSVSLVWRLGQPVEVEGRSSPLYQGKAWMESPFRVLHETGATSLRRRLSGPDAASDFPILQELAASGATDYYAANTSFREPVHLGDTDEPDRYRVVMSWTTDVPGGFTAAQLAVIDATLPALTVAFRVLIQHQIAFNVLTTYHGHNAGRRILSGKIRRGDGDLLHTVLWYADMRNSTVLAESLSMNAYLSVLNAYADCTAGSILEHGGEVLEIVGDCVLGIFRIGGEPGGMVQAALKAVRAAHGAHDRLSMLRREAPCTITQRLRFGIGLHMGSVIHGNIGTIDRLSFGLRGAAVNEAARIESLTKTLNRPVLASAAFAEAYDARWEAMGPHDLRGVERPMSLYALPLAESQSKAA